MSELTRCNRCKLESMKRRAEKKGQKITIGSSLSMPGWIAIYRDDDIAAYFLGLSERCVC